VDPTNLNTCREAAAKCRQEALSSADPEQWIRMAEMWEWLANAMDRMYLLGRELAQIEEIQKNMTWRQRHVHADHPPFCEAGSLYQTRAGMGRSRAAVAPRAAIRMPRPPDPRTEARRATARDPEIGRDDIGVCLWGIETREGGPKAANAKSGQRASIEFELCKSRCHKGRYSTGY
jgi:hypothetical protein